MILITFIITDNNNIKQRYSYFVKDILISSEIFVPFSENSTDKKHLIFIDKLHRSPASLAWLTI